MLTIDIITLFPKLFRGPLNESILRLAQEKKRVRLRVHNLRNWTHDRHRTCDDRSFGGGPGMVMKIEPIFECLREIKKKGHVVMLSPRGKPFCQKTAKALAKKRHLLFICGHYEGIDERVHRHLVNQEISIGDFITTGGEFPVLCVIDAVIRLIPGVLGNRKSIESESFENGLLEYPQYTRPAEVNGWQVPAVLRSGAHDKVKQWREKESLRLTRRYRPNLLAGRRTSSRK